MRLALKELVSPVREPFWKIKSFGLQRYHFFDADRIRFHCNYKLVSGEYRFPYFMEIDSKKVFDLQETIPEDIRNRFPKLHFVPWGSVDVKEERK